MQKRSLLLLALCFGLLGCNQSILLTPEPSPIGVETVSHDHDYVETAHAYSKRSHKKSRYECIKSFGNEVCGYNCVKNSSNIACASTPDQYCIAGDFGEIACGYHCVKSYSKVKCAKKSRHNCVIGIGSNIVCGDNCRVEFGKAVCDREA